MTKHSIVPGWIYSLHDYRQMFDLSEQDLSKSILDYPGSISSFNSEMVAQGHQVISGDEQYHFNEAEINEYANQLFNVSAQHLKKYRQRLKDASDKNLELILKQWQQNKDQFLKDYLAGKQAKRYQPMALPTLSFNDFQFELALCSDLLFHTKLAPQATPEHIVTELCRVAHEVRVFPLLNEKGETPEALGPVLLALQAQQVGVEIREVPYEQHQGSNAMLRLWATKCEVEG